MIKSKPTFSVVTVCFNDRTNLEKTANSVLGQKDACFEWVVVDGASKDGTVDFLKGLQQQDERLRWISEPDKGIYEAFNKGIKLSRNDYVVFICAGDLFCDPNTLRDVTAFIEKNPGRDLYYGDAFEVDQSGRKFFRKARSHTTIWWGIFTHHQSMFYARSCFDRLLYDESYRIGGDYALTAELLHSRPPAMQMPFPTAQFLLGGASHKNFWLGEKENWICRRKLGTSIPVCAAIFAAHAVIRFGRTQTPALYRALRYSTQPIRSAVQASSPTDHQYEASEIGFSVRGVSVNCLNLTDALQKILQEKASGKSFSVNTLNMHHIVLLKPNSKFKQAYSKARFVLTDGFPVVWTGRIAGCKVKRATGADLVVPLCNEAAQRGLSVSFIGSTQTTLEACATALRSRFPALKIVDIYAPSANFDPEGPEATEIINRLKRTRPDFCFLGLGAPQQEIFAERCVRSGTGAAFLCVGAALDYLGGKQSRAPLLLQRVGLEWGWRLALNPGRLGKRYFLSACYVPIILSGAKEARKNSQNTAVAIGGRNSMG